MRNFVCLVITIAGSWGVYKFLRSAFDEGFALGIGAYLLVMFVAFSYATIIDRRSY